MSGRPTIRPLPSFNADKDAEELRQAMKGIGMSVLINVIPKNVLRYLQSFGPLCTKCVSFEFCFLFEFLLFLKII